VGSDSISARISYAMGASIERGDRCLILRNSELPIGEFVGNLGVGGGEGELKRTKETFFKTWIAAKRATSGDKERRFCAMLCLVKGEKKEKSQHVCFRSRLPTRSGGLGGGICGKAGDSDRVEIWKKKNGGGESGPGFV